MKRRMISGLLVVFAVGAAMLLAVLGAVCVCAALERTAQPSDCIIVLGARVWPSGQMSSTLQYRCESALQAWKSGVAQNIIVTGGRGSDEPMTEASAMRAYFLENGVPEQNLFCEQTSVNTIENIANAKKIMDAHGWSRAAVVSSDYHVQRALWIARDAGIDACAVAAKSSDRVSTRVFSRLRETASWCFYVLRKAL